MFVVGMLSLCLGLANDMIRVRPRLGAVLICPTLALLAAGYFPHDLSDLVVASLEVFDNYV